MAQPGIEVFLPSEGKKADPEVLYDIIIVGGGPAGLTAAIYAARKNLSVLIISKDIGGQILWTTEVENYMGFVYIEAKELIKKFEEHVKAYSVDMDVGNEVERIEQQDNRFLAKSKSGITYSGKSVIIATGKRSRPLNVEGEKRLRGRGVSYCATCDAPFFKNMAVAVIGSGNSGLEALIDLSKIAKEIYCVDVAPDWIGDAILVNRVQKTGKVTAFFNHQVIEILGEDRVRGLIIQDRDSRENKTLKIDGVFIEIGLIPNSELVEGLVKLNKWKEIIVDDSCRTNVAALFAGGDVTIVPEKQIIVAAGEGCKAALAAYKYLIIQK